MLLKQCLTAGAFLAFATGAQAATFVVTKTGDSFDGSCDADCSLREAIQAANTSPGEDLIELENSTYVISIPTPNRELPVDSDEEPGVDEEDNATGDLDIWEDVKIMGGGSTVVDGNQVSRVFEVHGDAEVKIQDMAIINGRTHDEGGGVAVNANADLTLLRVRLANNTSASSRTAGFGKGGGGYSAGTLDIKHSIVEDNVANGGDATRGEGGGVYNVGRLLTVKTIFRNNHAVDESDMGGGGAVFNLGGLARLNQTLFVGNQTIGGNGGAILNLEGGSLLMQNSTVSGNRSGWPAEGGGAVANGSSASLALPCCPSTPEPGGSMRLHNVTIADNREGGVFNAGTAEYINTIVAGNFAGSANYHSGKNCRNFGDSFQASHTSLLLGDDGNCSGDIIVANDTVLTDVLFPLADNDGPTLRGERIQTHAVRQGPALDSAAGICPSNDQRGKSRPFDGDGDGAAICDIGAFERQAKDPL